MKKRQVSTQTIESFKEYTDYINEIVQQPCKFWYRGCGELNNELIPTLFRHPTKKINSELLDIESKIISRFKQRSLPFLTMNSASSDDWGYLFIMQHYGVPTRLLDWTENPFIGLYFALVSANYDRVKKEYVDDTCIWILRPEAWNKSILPNIGEKGILSQHDEEIKGYKPPIENIEVMNKYPIAIYGAHNSQRIVAQRGVFTIFGKEIKPMDEIFIEKKEIEENVLSRLIINKKNIKNILNGLISIGITDSVIFPDLEGLAKEIKRDFKYEV